MTVKSWKQNNYRELSRRIHPDLAKIVGDVKVQIKGDEVIVSGITRNMSKTMANMEQATKIREETQKGVPGWNIPC